MKLFLNGGGSDEQITSALVMMDKIIDHNRPLLYIPLAMDEIDHPYDSCYEWISSQLINVTVPKIDMVRSFDELSLTNLANYSAIFIGGGNTYKLLKGLKDSGSFDKIRDYILNDGIVFGGSAGSVVFGKDIDIISIMDSNNVNCIDTKGFNVVNGLSIFPHYTNKRSKLTDEENQSLHEEYTNSIINFSNTIGPVLAYPEENTLFIDDKSIQMLGTKNFYYAYKGKIIKYESFDKELNNIIYKVL